jgi:hypothetical protein
MFYYLSAGTLFATLWEGDGKDAVRDIASGKRVRWRSSGAFGVCLQAVVGSDPNEALLFELAKDGSAVAEKLWIVLCSVIPLRGKDKTEVLRLFRLAWLIKTRASRVRAEAEPALIVKLAVIAAWLDAISARSG